jgi:hypothetical protein
MAMTRFSMSEIKPLQHRLIDRKIMRNARRSQ